MFNFKNIFEQKPAPEKEFNAGEMHSLYMSGGINQDELFKSLPIDKVNDFMEYHRQFKESLSQEDRRAFFKANQLDNLIDKGVLEEKTYEAHGIPVVKKAA